MPRLPQLTARELIAFPKLLRAHTHHKHMDMVTCAGHRFDRESFALAAVGREPRLLK